MHSSKSDLPMSELSIYYIPSLFRPFQYPHMGLDEKALLISLRQQLLHVPAGSDVWLSEKALFLTIAITSVFFFPTLLVLLRLLLIFPQSSHCDQLIGRREGEREKENECFCLKIVSCGNLFFMKKSGSLRGCAGDKKEIAEIFLSFPRS